MIMDKQTIKKFNLAYDSLYDLNSKLRYKLNSALELLTKEAKE